MKAMDRYKRENRRPFPTWSEVLEVLRSLGYRRVAEPTALPGGKKETRTPAVTADAGPGRGAGEGGNDAARHTAVCLLLSHGKDARMKLFLSAGEPSGDLHGANLIRALLARDPTTHIIGFGGPQDGGGRGRICSSRSPNSR